ncbi:MULTISPECIES: hypothetical protein [unclassified Nocardioides]|uniref:hypothetical protein n=1 Tax=unclassified Nocardioides TaxID=2615069 RepID=UPI0007017986|nr:MULTISPECIES: hypothetical protein [unclassified Nocardioides]KRA31439.1 hypothetical protein ASD81_18570 [Nocardioides sp. Root614]KRA88059.1 hypothetical protein ASD84_18845 [Nocardioides sp. Root682]
MTEPTEDRAEQAFRSALEDRAGDVELRDLVPASPHSRRTALMAGFAAAAAVVAIVVPAVVLGGDPSRTPSDPATSAVELADGMRWVGYRGIEVQVPEDWPFNISPGRPDCIEPVAGGPPPGEGVPTNPYVEIYPSRLGVTLQGCFPDPDARGPKQFGELPVALWQPYVQFADAATMGNSDGEWEFQGWKLTVDTVDNIRISILAGPASEGDLAKQVLGSLRRVQVDTNGCETRSPVQAGDFGRPDGPAIPAAAGIDSVAICKYELVGINQRDAVRISPDWLARVGSREPKRSDWSRRSRTRRRRRVRMTHAAGTIFRAASR